MKRFFKTFLALSFALLQCIAPIAHAHINGSSADASIHLPSAQVQYGHETRLNSIKGAQDSPAVSAAQGCERQDRLASDSGHIAYTSFMRHAVDAHDAPHYQTPFHPLSYPSASFRKPFPQAPPAPISL